MGRQPASHYKSDEQWLHVGWLKYRAYWLTSRMNFSLPPTFEAMQPRKCLLLPNTGPPYSLNSLSRCHLTILPLLAFQSIWIPTVLQWGFRRIDQQLNSGTRPYSRNVESQAQIMIAFLYLYGIKWCPGLLSGAEGKIGLIKAGSLLSFHDLHAPMLTASVLDLVLITTLFSRFCIPQSTSLFTDPCRPFTSPFPQCQDVLHTPPTYVMTFWLVLFLLLVIPVALEWFESGMPISFHLTQCRPFSPGTSALGSFPFLLRGCLFILCLDLAFGDLDPRPPDSAIKPAFFWPATPLVDWVFSISVATILAICAIILRRGIFKLRALWFLRLFTLLQSDPKNLLNSYGVSLSSLRKAYSTTSYARSRPKDHPEKISKHEPKTYKHKRSPLTPHTFQSPFSRQETSELPLLSPDAQGPVDIMYEHTNPVELADIPAIEMEIIDNSNVDGAGLVVDSAGPVRDSSLQPRSTTPTPKEGVYFDSDDEDRFPCLRPSSRLGFNAEELSSRWNSSRVLDGDSEMEGTASMLFRRREMPQPPVHWASSSTWPHQLDPPLTPSCDTTPLSPCRTPSNHSSGSPSPPTPEISSTSEDDCEDWDAFPLSPAWVSYDWARAVSVFSDNVERGDEVEEFEKQRVFHLAQIPNLQTIDETSDEEMEMDLDS